MKSVKIKILSGFLVVIGLVLAMGVTIYLSIALMNNQTGKVIDEELPLLLIVNEIGENIAERSAVINDSLLYNYKGYLASTEALESASRTLEEAFMNLEPSQAAKEAIERIHEWENMVAEEVYGPYNAGNHDLAKSNFMNEVEPAGQRLITDFKALYDQRAESIRDSGDRIISNGSRTSMISIGIALVTVFLGLATAYFMANSLSKPIERVANRMKLIASGDLTHEDLPSHSKDEVGELIVAVNDMSRQIRSMVMEIGVVSETVTSQSQGLSNAAQEVNLGSRQVATTMEELSIASEAQATATSDLAESMSVLSENVMDANQHGIKASEATQEVLSLTHQGNLAMVESTARMRAIDDTVKEVVKKVQKLEDHSQQITQLVNVISDIARQTNLLALNASIEAARAGEHGKGFAIVANEVKKLAGQVASSVSHITGIVSAIQLETGAVVDSLQTSFEQVESGTEQIRSTSIVFERMTQSIQNVVEGFQVIFDGLSHISVKTEMMDTSIANIAALYEEASAGIEETAASAEQTTSSMQEIAANAESLFAVSNTLNQLVKQFKV